LAEAALAGLDTELARRLDVRALDSAALSDLSNAIRLPTMRVEGAIDAESLRGMIADGVAALLGMNHLIEDESSEVD
jgi:hypothetical protein